MRWILRTVLLAIVAVPIIAHAQVVQGRVTDGTAGVPLTGVVELTGSTDSAGQFSIADVLPGEYLVDVSTPIVYNTKQAECGVLVIHLRRR